MPLLPENYLGKIEGISIAVFRSGGIVAPTLSSGHVLEFTHSDANFDYYVIRRTTPADYEAAPFVDLVITGSDFWISTGGTFTNYRTTQTVRYDLIDTVEGKTVIWGTEGSDSLTSTAGADHVLARDGIDFVYASGGADIIDGGAGTDDRVNAQTGNAALFTRATAAQTYTVTNSRIAGSAGLLDTAITGIEGVTISATGNGNFDDVFDASGFTLGRVSFFGGAGNDTMTGSPGNDILSPGLGTNFVDGGAGIDSGYVTYDGSLTSTMFVRSAGGEVMFDQAGRGTDTYRNVENFQIGAQSATAGLKVDASAVSIGMNFYSADGADAIVGSSGADYFYLNSGSVSGAGDTLAGGAGADTYLALSIKRGFDGTTITDFSSEDRFYLSVAANDGLTPVFIGSAAFSGVAGEMRFESSGGDTRLSVDIDGNGVADATLTLRGTMTLAETAPGLNILRTIDGLNLRGTAGADTFAGSARADSIVTLGGNDAITGSAGADTIDGGAGTDRLTFNLGDAQYGTATGGRSYIVTSTRITSAAAGIDTSYAGIEQLTLSASQSTFADVFDSSGIITAGGLPTITIILGSGNNRVTGGAGAERVTVGSGINTLSLGAGTDSVTFNAAPAQPISFVATATGFQHLVGGAVRTTVDGADMVNVFGVSSRLVLDASGLNSAPGFLGLSLTGSGLGDAITGSAKSDTFIFNDDGTAAAELRGGGGDDYYSFSRRPGNGTTIADFDEGDVIQFPFGFGTSPKAIFIGSAAFSGVADQYRYQKGGNTTILQFDLDGDRVADRTLTFTNRAFDLVETTTGSNALKVSPFTITGTEARDLLYGTLGRDSIGALGGNDQIYGSDGVDTVDGGAGSDILVFQVANGTCFTAPTGARTYTLTANRLSAGDGAIDTSFSNIESVWIELTGTGDFGDTVSASAFVPAGTALSASGVTILTGNGNDTITGSAYADSITPGLGINVVDAGAGVDFVAIYTAGGSPLTFAQSGTTLFQYQGGELRNTITGAETLSISQRTAGQALNVDASAITSATTQSISFIGTAQADAIVGSRVIDQFGGTAGADVFTGSGGADRWSYVRSAALMDGDVITDFDGDDIIDLSGNTAANGTFLATRFIGNAEFSGVAGEYRYAYTAASTLLQVDGNGDGVADATLTLSNGAFSLVETTPGSNILTLAAGQQFTGGTGNDFVGGTTGADTFMAQDGGDDDLSGGDGDDGFFFGAAFTGADRVDGGAGTLDQVALQGNYAGGVTLGANTLSGVEMLVMLSGGDTRFGAAGTERFSYALTSNDGNVAAGQRLTINANGLLSGESLAFNGAAERDGEFTIFSGFGNDTITGGAGNDGFFYGEGTNGGKTRFTAEDTVDGGAGNNDQLGLRGDYGAQIVMSATTMRNIEALVLLSAYDTRFGAAATGYRYDVKSDDATVGAGERLVINANALRSDEYVRFDGSAETNGSFSFLGGAGVDTFVGGGGDDFIFGNLGADRLSGGGGNDLFVYRIVQDSTTAARDEILDFAAGDRIDLSRIDANVTGTGPANEAFRYMAAGGFTGVAGQLRATVTDGVWTVEGDVDGDGTADFSLLVTTVGGHVLSATDFVL